MHVPRSLYPFNGKGGRTRSQAKFSEPRPNASFASCRQRTLLQHARESGPKNRERSQGKRRRVRYSWYRVATECVETSTRRHYRPLPGTGLRPSALSSQCRASADLHTASYFVSLIYLDTHPKSIATARGYSCVVPYSKYKVKVHVPI